MFPGSTLQTSWEDGMTVSGYPNRSRATLVGGASALALIIGATPTLAQDQAAETTEQTSDDDRTPVIVVTAQFREQLLQDTPLAITAIDDELLEARSQTSLQE